MTTKFVYNETLVLGDGNKIEAKVEVNFEVSGKQLNSNDYEVITRAARQVKSVIHSYKKEKK